MSSILLSNPFVVPLAANTVQDTAALPAILPIQGTAQAQTPDDATAFGGSGRGSGQSGQGDTVALMDSLRQSRTSRPPDATGGSVVNAQGQVAQVPALPGANLPKVDMPDPLPTSPFLKQD